MLNISKKSKLNSKEVINEALKFFGPTGLGMEVKENTDCCAKFESFGGFVSVNVTDENDDQRTEVNILGREFEYQISKFLDEI